MTHQQHVVNFIRQNGRHRQWRKCSMFNDQLTSSRRNTGEVYSMQCTHYISQSLVKFTGHKSSAVYKEAVIKWNNYISKANIARLNENRRKTATHCCSYAVLYCTWGDRACQLADTRMLLAITTSCFSYTPQLLSVKMLRQRVRRSPDEPSQVTTEKNYQTAPAKHIYFRQPV